MNNVESFGSSPVNEFTGAGEHPKYLPGSVYEKKKKRFYSIGKCCNKQQMSLRVDADGRGMFMTSTLASLRLG
jgi:hypothetical protein